MSLVDGTCVLRLTCMSVIVQQLALDAAEAAEAAGQVHETMAMLGRSRLFVNGALLAVAHAAR